MDGSRKSNRGRGRPPKQDLPKNKKIKKLKKVQSSESQSKSYEPNQVDKKPVRGAKKITNRRRSSAKLGRPFQQDQVEVVDDPTDAIQLRILKYLNAIGLKHGLTFRESERKKMNEEGFKNWGSKDDLNIQDQRLKIKRNKKIQQILKVLSEKNNKISIELMESLLMNIGYLITKQCTNEIYEVLCEVIESNILNEDAEQQTKRINQLYQRSIFLNGNFTNVKVKYWLQIQEDSQVKQQHFRNLFAQLKQQFRLLLNNQNQMRKFFDEQKWMRDQLLKKKKTK